MFNLFRNTIPFTKHKNENDSSFDSNISESENNKNNNQNSNSTNNVIYLDSYLPDYKRNLVIKNKMQLKAQEFLQTFNSFNKRKEVNWEFLYKKLSDKKLKYDMINKNEIELRITSVLNQFDDKKERIIKTETDQNTKNNVLYKNNFPKVNKESYIPVIMSKYNQYTPSMRENKKFLIKKSKNKKENFVLSTKNLTGRLLKVDLNNKKNFSCAINKNKHILEAVDTNKRKTVDFNINNSPIQNNNKSNPEENVDKKGNLLIQKIGANMKSLVMRQNSKYSPFKNRIYYKIIIIFNITLDFSSLIGQAKNMVFANKQQENDMNNLANDIKSYEKELIIMNGIFNNSKNRQLNHFFVFDNTQEGIRQAKNLGLGSNAFFSEDNLNLKKSKIDAMIEKTSCNK
jgi:hypothetical protein